MRLAWALLVAAMIELVVGCGTQSPSERIEEAATPASEPSEMADAEVDSQPRFWKDDEGAEVIEALGYDNAYVYRWQNGDIEGWIQFDGQDRRRFDSKHYRPKNIPEEIKDQLDLKRSSGVVVVALRKQSGVADGSYIYQCQAGGIVRFDAPHGEESPRWAGSKWAAPQGNIRAEAGPHGDVLGGRSDPRAISLFTYANQVETPWTEIRFVPYAE
jgi:hypothetical protein